MKARVAFMLALLVALTGLYLTANAAGNGEGPQPIAQASPVVTPVLCVVRTGIDGGTVNLRACGSLTCAVLDYVTEGERLAVIAAGKWTNVRTEDGLTGYLNSKYCEGK